MAVQNNQKPSFDDRVAALRDRVETFQEKHNTAALSQNLSQAVMARVKAVVVCHLTITAVLAPFFAPVPTLVIGGAILALGAKETYQKGSQSFLVKSLKSVADSWKMLGKDAVSLVKLPYTLAVMGAKAAGFIQPAGVVSAAPKEVNKTTPVRVTPPARSTFGKDTPDIAKDFSEAAPRAQAPVNGNAPAERYNVSPVRVSRKISPPQG